MNERKATKRALLTSITALVMCVVMLAGTTFAWFTDTAKTNVNRIEAGKLDVQLMMKDNSGRWVNAEGETLKWVKAQGGENQAILWEPGAEYKLPELKIVNNGNLKLKYKIVITGASGDVDLLNVIDFSAEITGVNNAVFSNVNVRDNNPVVYDKALEPNKEDVIALSGKMQTSANNTYMSKTISGISITVYAAQATGEYDSISNQYDAAAAYPTVAPVLNLNTEQSVTLTSNALPATTISESGAVSTIPADTTMQNGSGVISGTDGKLERVIKTTIATNPATGVDTATYDISYNFTQNGTTTEVTEFSAIVTNVLQLASGLENVAVTHTHGSTTMQMIPAQTEDANTDGHFYYNKTTGKLTIWSMQYSAFAVSYKANFAAVVNGQFFNTLSDAVAAAEDGDTITLLRDVSSGRIILEDKSITVDLNGHTLTSTSAYGVMFCAKNGNTITVNGTTPGSKLVGTVMVTAETDGHIVLNGGTYENKNYIPVYINGAVNTNDSTLTITDAVINAIGSGNNEYGKWGVYLAGYATSTIENTTITASVTGIEIRAGKLALNDCALEATAKEFSCEPNGNGTTTAGAAIAIAQHTTKKDIAVTINGGSFKGVKALNESNPQVNDPTPQVKLSIDGGTFIGDVSTADVTGFIKGGTFSSQPDSSYVATGYTATESNGVWTVAKSTQSST